MSVTSYCPPSISCVQILCGLFSRCCAYFVKGRIAILLALLGGRSAFASMGGCDMRTIFLISMAVVVSFAGFAESAAYKKVTIGVGNIEYRAKDSDSTNRFRAISRSGPGAIREDSRAFVSMITTALVKTRKFTVIERDRMGEILQEQDMATSGLTRGGYRKKKLSMAGVQYILTGAITEFGVNKNKGIITIT